MFGNVRLAGRLWRLTIARCVLLQKENSSCMSGGNNASRLSLVTNSAHPWLIATSCDLSLVLSAAMEAIMPAIYNSDLKFTDRIFTIH